MRLQSLRLSILLLVGAAWNVTAPVQGLAQDPSVPAERRDGLSLLVFEQTFIEDVREGYCSLRWNEIEGVDRYELKDDRGRLVYSGSFNEAFVSGLPDGEHFFTLEAFSSNDVLMAVSRQSATIVVQHWSMTQAWWLVGIGALVFVSLIGLIVRGWWTAQRVTASARVKIHEEFSTESSA